ncbi:hypothetical protein LINPERPRIM_LOCUS4476 [Linum perenne]
MKKLFLFLLISFIFSLLQPFEALEHSVSAAALDPPALVADETSAAIPIDKKHEHHHVHTKKVMIRLRGGMQEEVQGIVEEERVPPSLQDML